MAMRCVYGLKLLPVWYVQAFILTGLTNNKLQSFSIAAQCFGVSAHKKVVTVNLHKLAWKCLVIPITTQEFELLEICQRIWHALKIAQNIKLEINSLGTQTDRQNYRQALVNYFEQHRADLTEAQPHRLTHNPLRLLDSKDENLAPIIAAAPVIGDYLSEASQQQFSKLINLLDNSSIQYTINPRLVRGLDYYNHCVWEWTTDALGAQGTVCAGGRYDGLSQQLGGPDTSAIGFSIGLERIMALLLQQLNIALDIIAFGFSDQANDFLSVQLAGIRMLYQGPAYCTMALPGAPKTSLN